MQIPGVGDAGSDLMAPFNVEWPVQTLKTAGIMAGNSCFIKMFVLFFIRIHNINAILINILYQITFWDSLIDNSGRCETS